jgi:hypothetical protein
LVVSDNSSAPGSAAMPATSFGSPRRSSGSPPVSRSERMPRRVVAIRTRRSNSASASRSGLGSQSKPSAGMQ